MNDKKKADYRQGIIIFIALAVLTAIEYFAATGLANPAVPVVLINIVKAALIIWYFMHIYRLWREEAH